MGETVGDQDVVVAIDVDGVEVDRRRRIVQLTEAG